MRELGQDIGGAAPTPWGRAWPPTTPWEPFPGTPCWTMTSGQGWIEGERPNCPCWIWTNHRTSRHEGLGRPPGVSISPLIFNGWLPSFRTAKSAILGRVPWWNKFRPATHRSTHGLGRWSPPPVDQRGTVQPPPLVPHRHGLGAPTRPPWGVFLLWAGTSEHKTPALGVRPCLRVVDALIMQFPGLTSAQLSEMVCPRSPPAPYLPVVPPPRHPHRHGYTLPLTRAVGLR